jgi:radical SAM superfamily enzyme YgiQ (UPF0313 family)
MNKQIAYQQVKETFALTRKFRISIRATFMMAYPRENKDDLSTTRELAKKLNPDIAKFNITVSYPGSKLYNDFFHSIVDGQWDNYQTAPSENHAIEFIPEGMEEKDIFLYWKKTYKHFYFRLSYIFYKLISIRDIYDIIRYMKGFKSLSQW